MNDPQQGKRIKIDIVRQRPSDQPYGDLMTPYLQDVTRARMQDPGSGDRPGALTAAGSWRSTGNIG